MIRRLDVFVEAIRGAEEDIPLQAQDKDLFALLLQKEVLGEGAIKIAAMEAAGELLLDALPCDCIHTQRIPSPQSEPSKMPFNRPRMAIASAMTTTIT